MSVKERMKIRKESRLNQGNTPDFWKKVRNWSLIVAAVGGAILTAGAGLPVAVVTIATVVTTAATATAGVAATTKKDNDD